VLPGAAARLARASSELPSTHSKGNGEAKSKQWTLQP